MDESNRWFHFGLGFYRELWLDTSLASMQAMTLMVIHTRILPKPGFGWHFSSHILARAIGLDYHRSYSKLMRSEGEQQSCLTQEMRKRVFWTLFSINVSTGARLGRPMPLRMEDIDVEFPIPIEDSEVSERTTHLERSEKCPFWPGIYFFKQQPLVLDLYNSVISVRRSSTEYVRNLERLNRMVIDWRQEWARDVPPDVKDGHLQVATLHIDSWAAEFQLVLHHPRLCTATSPEVMEENLDMCQNAANRLARHAWDLYTKYRGVDFTWHSTVAYVLAMGIAIHIHSRRMDQITAERYKAMEHELRAWLTIMGGADRVLRKSHNRVQLPIEGQQADIIQGTDELLHRIFKSRVDKVLGEANNVLVAASAIQKGYKQRQERESKAEADTSYPQPSPKTQIQQTDSHASTVYHNNADGAMTNIAPVRAPQTYSENKTHPPQYPEPYQFTQPHQSAAPQKVTYPPTPTSNPALVYTSHNSVVSARNQNHPFPASSTAYSSNQLKQPPPPPAPPPPPQVYENQVLEAATAGYIPTQYGADGLFPLTQFVPWDDQTTTAVWPNIIPDAYQQQQLQQQASGNGMQ